MRNSQYRFNAPSDSQNMSLTDPSGSLALNSASPRQARLEFRPAPIANPAVEPPADPHRSHPLSHAQSHMRAAISSSQYSG
jgi:hypothetical protein